MESKSPTDSPRPAKGKKPRFRIVKLEERIAPGMGGNGTNNCGGGGGGATHNCTHNCYTHHLSGCHC